MSYLIVDTETTTFPNPNLPAHAKGQARICQIAAILLDEEFNEVSQLFSLIKPAGWTISEGAFKAHGISMERCEAAGKCIKEIMNELWKMVSGASHLVAFNIVFDSDMLDIENYNMPPTDGAEKSFAPDLKRFCCMTPMTDVCKLPHKNGRRMFGNKYKWPTLAQAYRHVTGKELEGAHDALVDVRACADVFRYLKAREAANVAEKIVSLP